jgi:hypothetical protein
LTDTKLHELIAVEKGIKARAYSALTESHKLIQKADLFGGMSRSYQKRDEDGEDLPGESKRVQNTVREVLATLKLSQTELYDLTAQKDIANCTAKAPVIVDDVEVIPELPVTTLLFLEKQLTDLRTFILALPILDEAETWNFDANSGLYKSDPVQTHRTKKTQRPMVLYDATEKHPAQTQLITDDVIVGFWTMVKQSGALPKPEKVKLAARVEKLLDAVKTARERANGITVTEKPTIGARVFGYLLGDGEA